MEKAFYAFGTMNYINIASPMPEREATELLYDQQLLCEGLDDMLSVFKPMSEISRINSNAGIRPVRVSRTSVEIVGRAKQIYERTGGAFDITVRPAVGLWNIGHPGEQIPTGQDIESVRGLVSCADVEIDDSARTIFLKRPGMAIDLGGIAKGYAADLIRSELIDHGVESALINFGGTVLTIGTRPDGTDWRVGIQNPRKARGVSVGAIPLSDGALVTSGVNERYFLRGGKRYHHILDPRTCEPANSGVLSVTAAGSCAMDLDGYTTALFVMGAQKGIELADEVGLDVLYLCDNGDILSTRGFAEGRYRFSLQRAIA